jgi:hypothetical protein
MKRSARVPILTWHAMHVAGPGYASNDHAAFARDLETLHRLGLAIVPLATVAEALVHGRLETLGGCVGLSMDDGSDFDFHDLPHPAWGPQRGMLPILADFRARHGVQAQPRLHATSFAIVSPEARAELDRTCMIGCRWWNDGWWRAAEASGLMAVESHGWDHNHESLERTATAAPRGTFDVRDEREAEVELGDAARRLRALRGRDGPVLFAYPYGVAAEFLERDWLPRRAGEFGIEAAFGAPASGPVTAQSPRWAIPRYIFRDDWKSEGELEALLRDAGALPRRSWAARMFSAPPTVASAPAAANRATATPAPQPAPDDSWRDHLRTWEVTDARKVAGELFQRSFGHAIPDYPRHFVLVYSPPPGAQGTQPEVVAYVHQLPFEELYLCGGMCVDERSYRRMPRRLFEQVRSEGGLATIVTRDSMALLGESPASFGHVGEPRARAADLRAGFVDTGREHLMAYWRSALAEDEKARLVERVAAIGPF